MKYINKYLLVAHPLSGSSSTIPVQIGIFKMLVYEESRKIPGEKPLEPRERTNNKQAATKHIVSLRNMPTYIVSPKGI